MDIKTTIATCRRFIEREVWGRELSSVRGIRKTFFHWLRILSLAVHGFVNDYCTQRAAALTLVFAFSLAPALAVGFSVAKGFRAQDKIKPFIYEQLHFVDAEGNDVPEQKSIREMFDKFFGYVDEVNVEALGALGLIFVFYAAYKVLSSVERAMNHIWGVRKRRKLIRRLVDYMAVMVVSPVMLVLTALLAASMQSHRFIQAIQSSVPGFLPHLIGACLGLVLAGIALTFLYFFFPNTRVKFRSAIVGAIVAAVLLQALQYGCMRFQVGVAKQNAIYGGLAAMPIFLLWLYSSWVVVLLGAEISYAHANQGALQYGGLIFRPSPAYRCHLALGAMTVASQAFLKGAPPPSSEWMAVRLAAPLRVLRGVIERLVALRLLVEIQGEEGGYHPAGPPGQIRVGEVLAAIEEEGDASDHTLKALAQLGVGEVFRRQEKAENRIRNMTLLELAHKASKLE